MFNQIALETELLKWNEFLRINPNNAKAYVQRGMTHFKLANIEESIQDFDRAEQLNPNLTPYLWQRGLSYYYAKRFEEGAKQFEIDLTVNGHDAEETVWRYLCIASYKGIQEAKDSLVVVKNDPRMVMRSVYELYAGNCSIDDVLKTGQKEGQKGNFYSHLYLGLYYEVTENEPQAKEYITKAVSQYPLQDYMWNLASVHQQLRGWN
ncbi:tetratricopeptide repeat protein [Candidatus Gracilibacteria bacterium]|nr:tetratricopeptide repeat protein [Candidatus Gracilibacteria bacterium]NJM89918.1 tetratricopeptide repeat protein [Hydrococcus sp. RU_2_2]NJP21787.1 tetratricopeptide repeat protein [Hydrococcus sp. CRU_1_1]